MSRIIRKKWYLFTLLIMSAIALAAVVQVAQALLLCGDTVCFGTPEITRPTVADGLYFDSSTNNGNINVAVSYEEENVYTFNKEAFYSLDAGGTWSPADISLRNRIAGFGGADIPAKVVRLDNGRYVLVHHASNRFGGIVDPDVRYTVYEADGTKLVSWTRVDDPSYRTRYPSVAELSSGGFVVAWIRDDEITPNRNHIYLQRFDANGAAVGTLVRVSHITSPSSNYGGVQVKGLSDGGFVVTASRFPLTNVDTQIIARRFTATGVATTGEIVVEDMPVTSHRLFSGDIEDIDSGRFAVVWRRQASSNVNHEIRLRTYDANNNPEGSALLVNTTVFTVFYDLGNVEVIKLTGNGGIMVGWVANDNTTTPAADRVLRAYSQQIGLTGTKVGPERVSESIPQMTASGRFPFLVALSDGGYLFGLIYHINSLDNDVIFRRYLGATQGPLQRMGFALDSAWELPGGGLFGIDGIDGTYLATVDTNRRIVATNIPAADNVDLRFRLSDAQTAQEWISTSRSFLYAPSNDGEGGSISFSFGYMNANSVIVDINMPCNSCQSLQLYVSTATLSSGNCGTFSPWQAYGDTSTLKTQVTVSPMTDATCYKFRATATNIYNNSFNYDSANVVKVDRTPPALDIVSENLTLDQLTVDIATSDANSSIDITTYQVNQDPALEFIGTSFTTTLPNGNSTVHIEATDLAGNTAFRDRQYTVDVTAPDILIHGIEEGGVYGDNVEFLLNFTQPLTNVEILIDGQPGSTDLNGLSDGLHTLTVQGLDASGNLVIKTVNFTIDRTSLSINMVSPQARTYETNTVRIQYSSSHPLTQVWYTLNGGAAQQDLTLSNLVDGNYTLELFGEMAGGQTASVIRNFSVKVAVPELQISQPQANAVYTGNQLAVSFIANSPVSYQLGELTGSIQSGDILTLPRDGEHTLTLTAIHPVSGNVVSQSITFSTDSVAPTIELLSPRAVMYPFTEIPVEYNSNKSLKNLNMTLDNQVVSAPVLTQLAPGIHTFQISGEDSSGRPVSQTVQFTVSQLEIVRPTEGAEVISEALPPILPFEYAAQGTFTNFSYALDGGPQQLITQPPGAEISVPVAPGNHDIALRGTFNEFRAVRRTSFRIGSKNLSVGADSINYSYSNCNVEFTECDVVVGIKIRNTGDYDITEAIELRFDHIGNLGFQSVERTVAGLAVDSVAELTLPVLRARLGDAFSLILDPFAKISGEWPEDNHQQVNFQSGQITALEFRMPTDNAYFQDVSVFEIVKAHTAGPVTRVEYQVGDWTFVDDIADNGFESIVDMGLLSIINNCVRVIAYGSNSIALDSRTQCFKIKRLNLQQLSPLRITWSAYAIGTNRVDINQVDRQQLAIDFANARYAAMRQNSAVMATLKDGGRVVYRVLTNAAGVQGRAISQTVNMGTAPIVGGPVALPNGHGIFITTVDPNDNVCSGDGAIPIFVEPRSKDLGEMLQEELDAINAMFQLNLPPEVELLRTMLATVGLPVFYRDPSVKSYDLDLKILKISDIDVGITFLGWVWGRVSTQVVHIDIQGELVYGFTAIGCLVIEQDGDIDLVVDAKYEFGIKDGRFDLSTGSLSLRGIGIAMLDIEKIPMFPLSAIVYGSVKVYPQQLKVPLKLGVEVHMSIADRQLNFGPAHAFYQISVNQNSRLAKADIQAYPLILLGLGYGQDVKADMSLRGLAKSDWVGGGTGDTLFKYSKYDGRIEIKIREKYCFLGLCYKKGWKLNSVPYDQHTQDGTYYNEQDVENALQAIGPL